MDKVDRDKSVFKNQKEDVQRGLVQGLATLQGIPDQWYIHDAIEEEMAKGWQFIIDALAVLDNMEEEFTLSKDDLNMIRSWLGMAESEFQTTTSDFTEDWKLMDRIEKHYEPSEESPCDECGPCVYDEPCGPKEEQMAREEGETITEEQAAAGLENLFDKEAK